MTDLIINEDIEIWKPVLGYETTHQVSSLGNIRNTKSMKTIKPGKCGDYGKYRVVSLYRNGIRKYFMVHRVVAAAFLGPSKMQIDHINSDPSDNRLENLEYVTPRENIIRSIKKRGAIHNISKIHNKFKVKLYVEGKSFEIGCYKSLEEAISHRDDFIKRNGIN